MNILFEFYCLSKKSISEKFILTLFLIVTLLNLNNSIRFSSAAWTLVALLPIPTKKQGDYKGRNNFNARKIALVHGKRTMHALVLHTTRYLTMEF